MLNTGIKFFIIVLGFLWIPTASLSLPNCPSDQTERYHNCFGTRTYGSANYIGEWQNNKWHGEGVFTSVEGNVSEGIWQNGVFKKSKKTKNEKRRFVKKKNKKT